MFDLSNPIYQNAEAAREHLESIQWPTGPVCPHCGNVDRARIKKLEGKSTRPGVYKCNECRKPFSVTVGTVFERSKIPLHKWVAATHLMAASKKGISAHQMHRMLGVTYKTAWFMEHRIREAMAVSPKDRGPMGGEGKTVKDVLFRNVDRKSTLYTDQAQFYKQPGKDFDTHRSVNHSKDEWVRWEMVVRSTPTPLRTCSRCSSEACAALTSIAARPTCTATLPSLTSATTAVPPWASKIMSAMKCCWRPSVASASPIGGLVKPVTLKQRIKRLKRAWKKQKKNG